MKTKIDNGRKFEVRPNDVWWNLHYGGQPNYILDAWHGNGGWNVNAAPTRGGSYCGGGVTHDLAEAVIPAIKFLIDHGESKDLIVSSMFADERAILVEALFGLCP